MLCQGGFLGWGIKHMIYYCLIFLSENMTGPHCVTIFPFWISTMHDMWSLSCARRTSHFVDVASELEINSKLMTPSESPGFVANLVIRPSFETVRHCLTKRNSLSIFFNIYPLFWSSNEISRYPTFPIRIRNLPKEIPIALCRKVFYMCIFYSYLISLCLHNS